MRKLTKKIIDQLSYEILGAAIEVHKALGPGLLESVYEECMIYELQLRGIKTSSQQEVPVIFKGKTMTKKFRYDLLVEDCIIVELKAAKKFQPIDSAQAMTHAQLLKVPKSILINFNTTNIIQHGHKSFVNEFYRKLPDQ